MFLKTLSSMTFLWLSIFVSFHTGTCFLAWEAEPFKLCYAAQNCAGDFDLDGDCDGTDLAVFTTDFGRTDCPE